MEQHHFKPGQRVRHKHNGDRATVTEDGLRRDGDSFESWWNCHEWEMDITMDIIATRLGAIEEVIQKHNQWFGEIKERPAEEKHCHIPHDTLEDYKRARRNLLEFLSFAHSGDAEQQPAGLLDKIIDLVANYKNARTAQELAGKYK